MTMKPLIFALFAASGISMLMAPSWAQTPPTDTVVSPPTKVTGPKLSSQYSDFAGSQANADALVAGLREHKSVTLTASPGLLSALTPSATFTPATPKLGYGEVNIALSLAKADLAQEGITNPTPTQLAAALNGGTFATTNGPVTMTGVLAQRQSGLGWGQIANAMGVKLGSLMSATKNDKAGAKSDKAGKVGKSGERGQSDNAGGAFGNSGNAHSNSGHSGGGNGGGGGHGGGNGGGGGGSGGGGGGR